MSIKVLDVSYWQGTIDFAKVKKAGYEHVIIRAGYGTTVDPNFYTYAKSCALNGIKIGVYWFCYSTTIAEVKKEAAKCIETIKNYYIDLPIFYDFEYDTVNKAKKKGITLGMNECSKFTIEFCESMKKAGYTPGYYSNVDYYNNYFNDEVKNKGYAFWLAHYNSNQTLHTPPIKCDFFQYSESGKVSGINGSSVDMDVCYTEKYLDCRNVKKEEKTLSVNDIINAVIDTAKKELGYLEKKSNSQLDNKTANAGYNNYTKYWRDIKQDYQGQPWCACFVSWVFKQVFGLEIAKKLLKHWPYVYCPTLGSLFTKYANPKVGDIVIFYRNGEFAHTGIVISVNGDYFETIEGNASSSSGITPNGGAVVQKGYYNSKLPGTKFCRPDYSIVTNINTSSTSNTSSSAYNPATKSYLSIGDFGSEVKSLQHKLNILGFTDSNGNKLSEDSCFGSCTDYAVRSAQKKFNLEIDGKVGTKTLNAIDLAIKNLPSNYSKKKFIMDIQSSINARVDGIVGTETMSKLPILSISKNKTHKAVKYVQKYLLSLGYNVVENADQCFGEKTKSGVTSFQKNNNLQTDGIVGVQTWKKMLM